MLNNIVVMGRLTKDPELRHTQSGTAVASFTIACDRDKSSKDAEKETDFIDCVAWGKTGELVSKYFSKGRMAVVHGRLQIRSYKDKNDNFRKVAEINCGSVYFGDSKKTDSTGSSAGAAGSAGGYQEFDGSDDELPF